MKITLVDNNYGIVFDGLKTHKDDDRGFLSMVEHINNYIAELENHLSYIYKIENKLSRRNLQIKNLKKALEVAQQTRIVLGENANTKSEITAVRNEDGQKRTLHFEEGKTKEQLLKTFTRCFSGSWDIVEIINR